MPQQDRVARREDEGGHDASPIEVSLITPMYNEVDRIADNVRKILRVMESLGVSWEYVLVNDGSTDDSLAEAQSVIDSHPHCRIISYPANYGRGYALRQGFAAARGKLVITTESDLSWGENIIRALYDRLVAGESDMVIASVHLPGGGLENVPPGRRYLSSIGNIVMRWCLGGGITMFSGMTRGYRRKVIEQLHLETNHKEIHLEIVAKARALGFHIAEIPATIRWSPPGQGRRRGSLLGMFRFILPHLLGSYNVGATRILIWSTGLLLILGLLTTVFGILNKLFQITPLPMPNLVVYGLVLILFASICALFGGVSIQLCSLTRSVTHIQAQIKDLKRRSVGDAEPRHRESNNSQTRPTSEGPSGDRPV